MKTEEKSQHKHARSVFYMEILLNFNVLPCYRDENAVLNDIHYSEIANIDHFRM